MTADDNTSDGSDNSDSRRDDRSIDPDLAKEALAVLRWKQGFLTKERLATQMGMRIADIEELLDYLEEWRGVSIHELGKLTLVTAPEIDEQDAYAMLSDQREQVWRQLTGDDFPNPDDR